jgi:hypothetical protein
LSSEERENFAMKLPVPDQVVIEAAKLRDYLLSFAHPVGRFKAAVFAAYGCTADNWRQLEADWRRLVEAQDVNKSQSSRYGQKYEVRGTIKAPNGKSVEVVTVWIIHRGEHVPRFVTAHPGEKP